MLICYEIFVVIYFFWGTKISNGSRTTYPWYKIYLIWNVFSPSRVRKKEDMRQQLMLKSSMIQNRIWHIFSPFRAKKKGATSSGDLYNVLVSLGRKMSASKDEEHPWLLKVRSCRWWRRDARMSRLTIHLHKREKVYLLRWYTFATWLAGISVATGRSRLRAQVSPLSARPPPPSTPPTRWDPWQKPGGQ